MNKWLSKVVEGQRIATDVVGELCRNKKTLAVAESYTGGVLSFMIVSVPGASKVFWGSVVAYSNNAKTENLGVDFKAVERYGAVSKEVATRMAVCVAEIGHTDIGVSTTGIAGPGGGSADKPVGLGYIGIWERDRNRYKVVEHRGLGSRLEIICSASVEALKALRELLKCDGT